MRIGIPAEIRSGETRVAATPETVKKLAAGGKHQLLVQTGAGNGAAIPDAEFQAAGATIVGAAGDVYAQSDIVLKVRAPDTGELPLVKRGSILAGLLNPYDAAGIEALRENRRHRLRDGVAAADHARAVDGRPVLPGQYRRLQGGDRGGRRVPALHADADDRRRHGEGGARARARRRRRRSAGDRDREAPGRGDRSLRRAAGGEGAGRVARREVRRGAGLGGGEEAGRDRRRLRARDERGLQAPPGGADRRAGQGGRHRHHHRADPGPAGAGADQRGDGARHEAGRGDRRPGGGAGRQLPAHRARQGGREARREARRLYQPRRRWSRPTPPRSTRATSSTSSRCSSTPSRASSSWTTRTRSSPAAWLHRRHGQSSEARTP